MTWVAAKWGSGLMRPEEAATTPAQEVKARGQRTKDREAVRLVSSAKPEGVSAR